MAALEALERLKLPYLLEEERKALCKHKLDLLRLKYQRSGRYEKEDTLRKKVLEAELESTGKAATLPTPLQVKTVKAEDTKFESKLPVGRSKGSTNEDKRRSDLRKWFSHCKKTKQKIKRTLTSGIAHIVSSFNNTIITIADEKGNTLAWSSAGLKGFKGSNLTPF